MKVFIILLFALPLFGQCPSSIASLGNGNGIQICWDGIKPLIDSITYDSVSYAVTPVNGGQGDCYRSVDQARFDVLGNHRLEFTVNGITTICEFNDGEPIGVLPIKIVKFNAKRKALFGTIGWEVEDSDLIELQYSADGIVFEQLLVTHEERFSFLHVYEKDAYYRLKIQNFDDGELIYSDVLFLKSNTETKEYVLFPNPADKTIYVTGENEEYSIFDINGKTVLSGLYTGNSQDISGLPKGVYFVNIHASGVIKKLVKQ